MGSLTILMGGKTQRRCMGGGTLFVYHASGLTRVYNQVFLGVPDILWNKHTFELEGEEVKHTIHYCRGDNIVYKSKRSKEEL